MLFCFNLIGTQNAAFAQDKQKSESLSSPGSDSKSILFPAPFVAYLKDTPSFGLLVEKKSQKLYLYKLGKNISLIKTYFCSTGQVEGNKKEQGDQRTPEGIYFFKEIKDGENLPARYGLMAFVMDYPNNFDVLEKRNGYGIWLHATDEPNRALLPNDTKGCVVVQNEDIAELSNYIKLYETPIIVVHEITYTSLESLSLFGNSLGEFVSQWKVTWENKAIENYLSFYSRKFISGRMNWRKWRNHKRRLNSLYSSIQVHIDDLMIIRHNSRAIIKFTQHYRSDLFSDVGTKLLYLWQEKEEWKIVGEEWRSIEEMLALETNRRDSANGRR